MDKDFIRLEGSLFWQRKEKICRFGVTFLQCQCVSLQLFVLFSPHPYLFFNQDRMTMTFLGFFINSANDLVDPQTGQTLEKGLISKPLRNGLKAQGVDFTTDMEKLKK